MNSKKFAKYKMLKRKRVLSTRWFGDFLGDKPTRKQFSKILTGMVIMADDIWLLTIGRKL